MVVALLMTLGGDGGGDGDGGGGGVFFLLAAEGFLVTGGDFLVIVEDFLEEDLALDLTVDLLLAGMVMVMMMRGMRGKGERSTFGWVLKGETG